ncbi:cytochrome-c peroxidase [Oceanospirillum sediminis]|uniref:Cytochrome c domain-containing protein n=1 Tax=Oceanospirillum sediminis TaxID=2760088 RepID=A0A839IR43_9GAMM|nr:cytochrome c peroxidase [Oceanospirillum sediminis]MBB1487391.1 hypothetical protein [Oceanospirillum sediminis]
MSFHSCVATLVALFVFLPVVAHSTEISERNRLELELGKRIFFNTMFSESGATSCSSCHRPEYHFADRQPLSEGDDELLARVNTPALFSLQRKISYFHQGTHFSLEDAIKLCLSVHQQLSVLDTYLSLRNDPELKKLANQIYGRSSAGGVYQALSQYLHSIEPIPSRYDDYLDGIAGSLSDKETEGMQVFRRKGCHFCHSGRDLGGNVKAEKVDGNQVREVVVPRLRNASKTPPYFYAGNTETLTEAILSMSKKHNGVIVSRDDAEKIAMFLRSHSSELRDFEGQILNDQK